METLVLSQSICSELLIEGDHFNRNVSDVLLVQLLHILNDLGHSADECFTRSQKRILKLHLNLKKLGL